MIPGLEYGAIHAREMDEFTAVPLPHMMPETLLSSSMR